MKLKRALRRDDGAAMVEFAIIFPILILLAIGIVNCAWLLGQQLEVNAGARNAARAAVVTDTIPVNGTAQEKVDEALDGYFHLANGAEGDAAGDCDGAGQQLSVTVDFENGNGWLVDFPPFSGGAKPLSATAVFQCER